MSLSTDYQKAIIDYQNYLDQVQKKFDHHCDEIRNIAKKEISLLSPSDEAGKKESMNREIESLKKTMSELQIAIQTADRKLREKLEFIQNQMESAELETLIQL